VGIGTSRIITTVSLVHYASINALLQEYTRIATSRDIWKVCMRLAPLPMVSNISAVVTYTAIRHFAEKTHVWFMRDVAIPS
jgi:hypothetical protein